MSILRLEETRDLHYQILVSHHRRETTWMSGDQNLPFLLFGLNVSTALVHKSLSNNAYAQCSLEMRMKEVAAVCLPM